MRSAARRSGRVAAVAAAGAFSIALAAEPTSTDATFSKDVAPIFQKACDNCHRPGSIAPMSLLSYKDARPWAKSIKEKVALRVMPPWHIDKNVGVTKFKDDPSLSEKEIATISNWVDRGAPEGNPADMPPVPSFGENEKWHLGTPDLVVKMDKPYMLRARGGDEYADIDIDPGFREDMYISAVETRPELGYSVIHHATTNLVDDPDEDPIGLFLNEYAVGKLADIFPANSGRLIKAGSKIHLNVHLHANGKETPVSLAIAFKVMPKGQVPKYVAFTQHMGDVNDLDLAPNTVTRNDGYFRLPHAAVLSAFQPHFHMLGKAQCIEAIYPDIRADSARPGPAHTDTLSCVSNYQFGWSVTYPYAEDVAPILPAGTIIHVTTWHDNTDRNPHALLPRNWAGSGQRSVDEMSFAWISLFYIDDDDYKQRIAARAKGSAQGNE